MDSDEEENHRRTRGGPETKTTVKEAEKKRWQLSLTISSGTSGPEDKSQLLLAKDSQEGGPVSNEEVGLMDYKLN